MSQRPEQNEWPAESVSDRLPSEEGEGTQDSNEPKRTKCVSVNIPMDSTADSTMSIYLGASPASTMLQNMTGVKLQTIDETRYLALPNGIKVVPSPSFRIDGFTEEGIDGFFPPGTSAAPAIRSGKTYKQEIAGIAVQRSCVSFIISAQAGSDIILEIRLGRELGDKITKRLVM